MARVIGTVEVRSCSSIPEQSHGACRETEHVVLELPALYGSSRVIVTGGMDDKVVGINAKGSYQRLALVTSNTTAMSINREELFGPVASVIRVGGCAEALPMAIDAEFGLASGACNAWREPISTATPRSTRAGDGASNVAA